MPRENEPVTLYDDFIDRAKNNFRPEFIQNVNNPSLLCDFLTCLEEIDREVVKAQQTQYGAMTAASILFDRVIKRPDWIDDLTNALRNPQIGLTFLAEKLHKFEGTIPVKWDLISFTDEFGNACFNGNCSDINSKVIESPNTTNTSVPQEHHETVKSGVQETNSQQTKETPSAEMNPLVEQETSQQKISFAPSVGIASKNARGVDELDASGVAARPQIAREVTSSQETEITPVEQQVETVKSLDEMQIELRREDLRLKFMEKIYSFINSPKDLPVAIHYLKEVNNQIYNVDQGSIIISIYIGSLDALQSFEKLWRFGGLKKLLDKEMIGEDMVKALKAIADENGHPVDNIKSELQVFDTDIERCRSNLMKSSFDFLPKSFAELSMVRNKNDTSKETREIAMYAMQLLPDELKSLFEDTFIFDRATRLFESEPLKKRLVITETSGTFDMKSVSQIFTEWLNSEIEKYLKELDSATHRFLITLAVFLVHSFDSDGTLVVPQEVLLEKFIVKETKTEFAAETTKFGFWGDLIELPSELVVNKEALQTACRQLMKEEIIVRSRGSLNFHSDIIRDAFVTKVLLRTCNKGSIKTFTDSFSYMQTLIGLFEMGIRYVVNEEAKREAISCSFKTDEMREIGISGERKLTITSRSSFYTSDLISFRSTEVNMDASINKAGEIIKKCRVEAKTKTHNELVDFSQPMTEEESFVLEDGLHWLNATANNGFKRNFIGLSVNNHALIEMQIGSIGRYLNVSPSMYEISLRNCQMSGSSLRQPLEIGHFRNIRHLNISDNALFEKSTRQIGLMYATSLKNLEVQNCSLGDEGMKHLALDLCNMGHLRQLNVANNKITARGLLSLTKAIGENKSMTGLRIHRNLFGRDGSAILASWLESLILLEVLNISECGIGDKGSPIIASALVSRSLRKLSMRKNDLSARGSRDFFKNFQRPPYLEHLDFSENKLFAASDRSSVSVIEDLSPTATEEPFRQFLEHPQPMSHLSLWNTCLGQRRIFLGMGNFKCFEEMTYLCLQENNISDEFAGDVSDCIKQCSFKYLQHFNLRQNHIGNDGAKCIAEALAGQKYLKEILLDRNEIGHEGANQIVSSCIDLPSLERLDLSCNNFSRKMVYSIFEGLVDGADTDKGSTYTGTGYGVRQVRYKQSSFDENNFIISRDVDEYLVTM